MVCGRREGPVSGADSYVDVREYWSWEDLVPSCTAELTTWSVVLDGATVHDEDLETKVLSCEEHEWSSVVTVLVASVSCDHRDDNLSDDGLGSDESFEALELLEIEVVFEAKCMSYRVVWLWLFMW